MQTDRRKSSRWEAFGHRESGFFFCFGLQRWEIRATLSVVVASLNTRSKNKRHRRLKGPTLYRMMPIENVDVFGFSQEGTILVYSLFWATLLLLSGSVPECEKLVMFFRVFNNFLSCREGYTLLWSESCNTPPHFRFQNNAISKPDKIWFWFCLEWPFEATLSIRFLEQTAVVDWK